MTRNIFCPTGDWFDSGSMNSTYINIFRKPIISKIRNYKLLSAAIMTNKTMRILIFFALSNTLYDQIAFSIRFPSFTVIYKTPNNKLSVLLYFNTKKKNNSLFSLYLLYSIYLYIGIPQKDHTKSKTHALHTNYVVI